MNLDAHAQVPVKVNAYVDEGVADLVAALATVPGLVTVDSCQGRPDRHEAWVMFRMIGWRDAGEVLFDKLLPALPESLRGVCVLKLEAFGSEFAFATMSCQPDSLPELTTIVRRVLSAEQSA